jgi:hypothetical protein
MGSLAARNPKNPATPPDSPEHRVFVPWTPEALEEVERPTTPYAITDRLPPTAPARRQPPTTRLPRPAPTPRTATVDWRRWTTPALIAGGVIIVLAVLVILAGRGGALGQRLGLHTLAATGGAASVGAASANGAAPASAPAPGDALSGLSAADLLPAGVPIKRTDWVITKDYAAHGGDDPVSREKWGAVDFAFWHNKDAFGAEIIATHAGTIKLLQDDPTYGNLVYVMGPHYTTTYGHMQGFNVTEGQVVHRGDVIGFMGSTGNSSGPHVDYQVWQDGHNQNPMDNCQCGMEGSPDPEQ